MRYFIFILILCCLCIPSVGQEEQDAKALYVDPPSRTHLKKWLMIGPIPILETVNELMEKGKFHPDENEEEPNVFMSNDTAWLGWPYYSEAIRNHLLTDTGSDADIQPEMGMTHTVAGQPFEWELVLSDHRRINLDDVYERHENVVVYAYTEIEMTEPKPVQLFLRSDDSMLLWHNGEPVYSFVGGRGIGDDVDSIPVDLVEGTNRIMVKVINFHLNWGFSVHLRDVDDLPLEMVIENSIETIADKVSTDPSSIWVPITIFLTSLLVLIGLFLIVAKMFGGGDSLNQS